ncbi:DUF3310 domain-containing protein [Exiguobacterium sp. S3]|uniref:DUF3310 domain-containing protein n=1 Tax=Exiguobacterium sp. S3 TaxID=483245 RepID=UPI002036DAE2|nr:DUF3310 domain-containing protein [Exiguobacterium sp. S3]
MKKIIGGVYLLNKDYLGDPRKELYRGDAVVLKRYLPIFKQAIVEFDGMKFSIDPSYLDFIEGDAPVEPQDEPQKPAHYDTGIDTIAFLRANCPSEQVEGFLRGNALKYLQRYDKKNGLEDLRKAKHYVEMLIEEVEGR